MEKICLRNKNFKVKGGGTFGYSWTGGYGISGTNFENLNIERFNQEILYLNQDMHRVCKDLFNLGYSDPNVWWVIAHFVYN